MKADIGQFSYWSPMLVEIALAVEEHFGFEFTITSPYRIDDSGVHGTLPLRGIDLRCFDDEVGIIIEAWINRNWTYDSNRPHKMCCIFHDTGKGNHLHIQTHSNTVAVLD